MTPLPVSVVVAHKPSREAFFRRFGLPSIEANRPAEIIIEDEVGCSAVMRNRGARKAAHKYLFHADDDIVYGSDCFAKMVDALEAHPGHAFAYSGFYWITLPGVTGYPYAPVHENRARAFSREGLRFGNYIDMSAMIRRSEWIGLDEDPVIERLNDWDLWIRMAALGKTGIAVDEALYHVYNTERGLTASQDLAAAGKRVVEKNNLWPPEAKMGLWERVRAALTWRRP